HRHLQAIERRARHPESSLWETEAGRAWLIRLIVATLFVFGLKRGVGADTLSEFCGRLRLDSHVGCSPSALRTVMHMLERLLLETAAAWEKAGIAHGEIRPVIGAVDETFLQRMMLVFMDLVYRSTVFWTPSDLKLCGISQSTTLCMSHLRWGFVAMPSNQPCLIVLTLKLVQRQAKLFDRIKGGEP